MSNATVTKRRTRDRLRLVADSVYGTAWHLKRAKLEEIRDFLTIRLQGGASDAEKIRAEYGSDSADRKPKYELVDGVAVLEVLNTLTKRANLLTYYSGGTSYEVLGNCIRDALADGRVKALLLRFHTPGGSAMGPAEISDLLYESRSIKPIWGIADGIAASAGYYLLSACERVFIISDGDAGSIGTYWMHTDYSEARKLSGEKVTIIQAGKYKTVGHPDKPINAADQKVLQAWVNYYNSMFVEAVSRNRDLSLADTDVWAEGREFVGQQAIDVGLADSIGTFTDVLSELRDQALNPTSVIVPNGVDDPQPDPPPDPPDLPEILPEPEESSMSTTPSPTGGAGTAPAAGSAANPPPPAAPAIVPAATPAAAPAAQSPQTITLSADQFDRLLAAAPLKAEAVTVTGDPAIAAERTRCAEIHALGERYNDPQLAATLIAQGSSIDAAKAGFFDKLYASQPPVTQPEDESADPTEAKLRTEYAAERETYQQLGLTEESYVRGRLLDMGKEPAKK